MWSRCRRAGPAGSHVDVFPPKHEPDLHEPRQVTVKRPPCRLQLQALVSRLPEDLGADVAPADALGSCVPDGVVRCRVPPRPLEGPGQATPPNARGTGEPRSLFQMRYSRSATPVRMPTTAQYFSTSARGAYPIAQTFTDASTPRLCGRGRSDQSLRSTQCTEHRVMRTAETMQRSLRGVKPRSFTVSRNETNIGRLA